MLINLSRSLFFLKCGFVGLCGRYRYGYFGLLYPFPWSWGGFSLRFYGPLLYLGFLRCIGPTFYLFLVKKVLIHGSSQISFYSIIFEKKDYKSFYLFKMNPVLFLNHFLNVSLLGNLGVYPSYSLNSYL